MSVASAGDGEIELTAGRPDLTYHKLIAALVDHPVKEA